MTVLEGKVTGSLLVSTAPPSFRDRPLRSLRSARMSGDGSRFILLCSKAEPGLGSRSGRASQVAPLGSASRRIGETRCQCSLDGCLCRLALGWRSQKRQRIGPTLVADKPEFDHCTHDVRLDGATAANPGKAFELTAPAVQEESDVSAKRCRHSWTGKGRGLHRRDRPSHRTQPRPRSQRAARSALRCLPRPREFARTVSSMARRAMGRRPS